MVAFSCGCAGSSPALSKIENGLSDMNENLVYVGKIIQLEPIPNSDFIESATVVCGSGGKWQGVVKKNDFSINDKCIVYLPDSLVPQTADMQFMKATNWRVRMRRFRGAPSEVLIMNVGDLTFFNSEVGSDITKQMGVTKYFKPIPVSLQGEVLGEFPSFIPKTDEPNYQNEEGQHGISKLIGKPYYITEKMDGSSTTAYRNKHHFGVCSRNLELVRNENNGYWKMAIKYDLENKLPEGYALQWETCGPGINCNNMGCSELSAFAFSAYKIDEHRYLELNEFYDLCISLNFPMCEILEIGQEFDSSDVNLRGEGMYKNAKPHEGVVIRSKENLFGHKPISFKVINLNYES